MRTDFSVGIGIAATALRTVDFSLEVFLVRRDLAFFLELIELFENKGIIAEKTDVENSLLLHGVSDISRMKEYKSGYS